MKATKTKDGTIIEIFVIPNAPKFQITVEDDEVIVRCTEEPTKSKVNKELIKEFTKLFHAKVELASGASSKQKKLLIKDWEKNETECLFDQFNTDRKTTYF